MTAVALYFTAGLAGAATWTLGARAWQRWRNRRTLARRYGLPATWEPRRPDGVQRWED